ncbi:MAG: hypothetical protein RSD83_20290 [Hafnia sp.]|uniref:hypothetical protein n=1 Tax=Hafnia sp. TaxID=1873498 RepID=UPI002FCAB76B
MQPNAPTLQTNSPASNIPPILNKPLTFVLTATTYVLILAITGLIIYHMIHLKVDIQVDMNLGQLIGGGLVGIGAGFAGVAYAYDKIFASKGNNKPNQ